MYFVRWKQSAIARLTEIWLDSPNRSVITESVTEIDRLLSGNPREAGESRTEHVRILFAPPLGVFFEVEELTRTVQVLRVWTF